MGKAAKKSGAKGTIKKMEKQGKKMEEKAKASMKKAMAVAGKMKKNLGRVNARKKKLATAKKAAKGKKPKEVLLGASGKSLHVPKVHGAAMEEALADFGVMGSGDD